MHEAAWPSSLQSLLSLSSLHVLQLMLRATKIQTIISLGRRSLLSSLATRFDAASSVSSSSSSARPRLPPLRVQCHHPLRLVPVVARVRARSSASLEADTTYGPSYVTPRRFFLPRATSIPLRNRVGRKGRRKGPRKHLLTEVKGALSAPARCSARSCRCTT